MSQEISEQRKKDLDRILTTPLIYKYTNEEKTEAKFFSLVEEGKEYNTDEYLAVPFGECCKVTIAETLTISRNEAGTESVSDFGEEGQVN